MRAGDVLCFVSVLSRPDISGGSRGGGGGSGGLTPPPPQKKSSPSLGVPFHLVIY